MVKHKNVVDDRLKALDQQWSATLAIMPPGVANAFIE